VPDLLGQTQENAEAMLTDLGLLYTITPKSSDTVAEGLVISQGIAPETVVSPGRTVVLEVSSGVQKVEVPDLLDSTQRVAEMNLNNLGLTVSVSTEYNEEVEKDHIIYQSPAPGTWVPLGTTVEILVSMGKEPVEFVMENLIGKTLEEAHAYIEEHDLQIVTETPVESMEYPVGVVVSQSIEDGTTAMTGDSIEITYSEGPGPEMKTYTFNYYIPFDHDENGAPVEVVHEVKVIVTDIQGDREVFNQQLAGGSHVMCDFTYANEAIVTLLVDGTTVQTMPIR